MGLCLEYTLKWEGILIWHVSEVCFCVFGMCVCACAHTLTQTSLLDLLIVCHVPCSSYGCRSFACECVSVIHLLYRICIRALLNIDRCWHFCQIRTKAFLKAVRIRVFIAATNIYDSLWVNHYNRSASVLKKIYIINEVSTRNSFFITRQQEHILWILK